MASLPADQGALSQKFTTAPANNLSVTLVNDTQTGGVSGSKAMGSMATGRPSEDH